MKEHITLGTGFKIHLPTLLETRALIAANSGGGKSWLLRRLLERTNGEVQQIVIDLEGEFYTLREKFSDYILIGKDGDMPAHVPAAAMLATKLLELGISAIIDLSELKFNERKRFVRLFLESLIEAPEELRHPTMVALDEAHHFAPQAGESEATAAVIDLMTRGRKRQLCGVLATQRVSKLHKDAIAECNNKMFGRTGQDIDVKRTNDELGFTSNKKEAFETLRNLKPGEFFAFGTAIGHNVERYKVGDVRTTHFRRGKQQSRKTPPPKSAIKKILQKLSDLPQEAERKAKNEAELKKENAALKTEITRLEKSPNIDQKAIEQAELRGRQQAEKEWENVTKELRRYIDHILGIFGRIESTTGKLAELSKEYTSIEVPENPSNLKTTFEYSLNPPPKIKPEQFAIENTDRTEGSSEPPVIKAGARRMLEVLVSHYPMKFTRSQFATLSNMSPKSGTFSSYLSTLRRAGYIHEQEDVMYASQQAIDDFGGSVPEPKTPEEVREMWRGNLKKGARNMFDALVRHYPMAMSRETLGDMAGISHTSGTFSSYLSTLRRNGLLHETEGRVTLSESLF